MEPDQIFTALRARRLSLGMSCGEVAHLLGCGPKMVDQWEGGHSEPSLRRTREWAQHLGMVIVAVEAADVIADWIGN
jgi:transcriptional regulator with XRE-family HTH domain